MFDYDNDGHMDLFFTNGALLKDPMTKAISLISAIPILERLYHQQSDGTFEDVTERAGLKGDGYSMGVAAADYDNDGYGRSLCHGLWRESSLSHNGNGILLM